MSKLAPPIAIPDFADELADRIDDAARVAARARLPWAGCANGEARR